MSYPIPTLAEINTNHKARLESAIGQTSPTNDKAFISTLAKTEAAEDIGLYKFAADRSKQNLALTATGDDLDRIGNDNSVARKAAQTAILTATMTATTGVTIPATIDFISDANGLRYRPVAPVVAVANVATLSLKCVVSGSQGNLDVGETLEIASQIAGAPTTATVTVIATLEA